MGVCRSEGKGGITMERRCSKCTRIQPIENFNFVNKAKNKRGYICKDCRRRYDKATRKKRYESLRSRKKESDNI